MAKIIINKDYFKNLSKGTHTLRANFKDGYAEGQFEVGDKITFYIIDTQCTATAGMTWMDWFTSSDTVSGNNYVVVDNTSDRKLYLNHRSGALDYRLNALGCIKEKDSYNFRELALHKKDDDYQQTLLDVIEDGATYGLINTGDDAPE
jgi:hypothetical protein